MEEDLIGKISAALRRACLPDANPAIHLEETGPNRVGGLVISTKFVKMAPSTRQDVIWQKLDEALSPPERARITFIAAETKEEHEALAEVTAPET